MNTAHAEFDGAILQRGFWLYVWIIRNKADEVLYVGRTGDSSSKHASSPFRRLSAHLDEKMTAKGASMLNQLRKEGLEPESCHFRMVAFGPMFKEQSDFEKHKPYRDRMAGVERDVATFLKKRGHHVLGTHDSKKPSDNDLLEQIIPEVERKFPAK